MRKNTALTLKAWHHDRAHGKRGDSVWTDGISIYSYWTCLVTPVHPDEPGTAPFIFNATKYNPTTSTHQNVLLNGGFHWDFGILPGTPCCGLVTLDDVPQDTDAHGLRELAWEVAR